MKLSHKIVSILNHWETIHEGYLYFNGDGGEESTWIAKIRNGYSCGGKAIIEHHESHDIHELLKEISSEYGWRPLLVSIDLDPLDSGDY